MYIASFVKIYILQKYFIFVLFFYFKGSSVVILSSVQETLKVFKWKKNDFGGDESSEKECYLGEMDMPDGKTVIGCK